MLLLTSLASKPKAREIGGITDKRKTAKSTQEERDSVSDVYPIERLGGRVRQVYFREDQSL